MYFSFVHISSFATKLHFSSESQTILWEKLRMVVGKMEINSFAGGEQFMGGRLVPCRFQWIGRG
jgi:hypothetical protein